LADDLMALSRMTPRALGAVVGLTVSAGLMAACGGAASSTDAPVAQTTEAPAPLSSTAPVATRKTNTARMALSSGRKACRGSSPSKVIARALPRLRPDAPARLRRVAEHPPRAVRQGEGYALLAGAVYAASQPRASRPDAAAGCAYELKKTMSKKSKGTS
jgi:hypothetical protein